MTCAYSLNVANDEVQKTKRCTSCGGEYLLEFFRTASRSGESSGPRYRTQRHWERCIGCESLRKRDEPIRQRLRKKAMATRRRHGAKLKELGLIKDENDLERMYGWSLDRMIDDIERVSEKGCPYCLQYVNGKEHGNLSITLDILNADQAPHYSTNVTWCCSRCNSENSGHHLTRGEHASQCGIYGDRIRYASGPTPKHSAFFHSATTRWIHLCFGE